MSARDTIVQGKAVLGIEFGSTRIKAVLINEKNEPIASGSHDWENQLENGIWTYSLEAIWAGLQDSYVKMVQDVKSQYGVEVKSLAAIGFSAMMHGYMPLIKKASCWYPSEPGGIPLQSRRRRFCQRPLISRFHRDGVLPIFIRLF